MIVLFLFLCSGATALVYEVVWSKYLTLMFGSTVQAQTVVLAVFMGGLALGNRLFGHRADLLARPLAAYGYVEIAIGLYAFFFDRIHAGADALFVALGSGRLEHHGLLLVLKAVLSVALLLGPTVLMGGTLPLLAGWLQQRFPDAGRWSARFYSVNSLGAVVGAGLAGFVLVRELGLEFTLQATALVNVLVGFTAIGLARRQRLPDTVPAPEEPPAVLPAAAEGQSLTRAAALVVALTGGVSMGLEVLASRSLVLIVGASLQAFAVVLMAFIVGIGLGSAAVASPRLRSFSWERLATGLLLGSALWIGLLVCAIEQWVIVFWHLKSGLARTDIGFWYYQLLTGFLSMVILGVPAALIGAVLPVCMRAVSGAAGLADRVGRLLTWNTLGAVGGSLLAGFVLMPALGLRGAFFAEVLFLCLGAAALAATRGRWAVGALALAVAAGLLGTGWVTGEGWRHVLTSGVFRMHGAEVDPDFLARRKANVRLLFYQDAADATIGVEEWTSGPGEAPQRYLRVNGKVDASSKGDLPTQVMMAHLPMLARPDAKSAFVLGLGSGITAAALLKHPVEHVVVAENCEPVIRAAKHFEPWNDGVLTNTRARILNDDGRTVLRLNPATYDVIISEPSNPWTVGIGSVFSRQYYELCARRLKPGGMIAQWFHVYEMNDPIVALVLRTFCQVFPHVEVWDVNPGDIILLGSSQPWSTEGTAFRTVLGRERVRHELELIGIRSEAELFARLLASRRTSRAIPGDGPIQSDFFPLLEYEAPQAFFLGRTAHLLALFDERTWQKDLLPDSRRQLLGSLDEHALQNLFKICPSINEELNQHLAAHRAEGLVAAHGLRSLPCAFYQPPADTPPPPPSAMSGDLRLMLDAEKILRKDRTRWREGVLQIADRLQAAAGSTNAPAADWSPVHFAAIAAVKSFSEGDVARGNALLELGLKIEPGSLRLHFLARIFERETRTNALRSGRP